MRTLIVGAGAIGGYFGGRLLRAGREVTFFVRPRRAATLAQDGLRIRSPHGDFTVPSPPTLTSEQLREPFDLAIVSCKAKDLEEIVKAAAPAVGPHTAILPLLNGIRHLEVLDQHFGREQVLGGECLISVTRDAEGTIVHLTEPHAMSFGERDGARSIRAEAIYKTLSDAGFDVRLSENVLQDMWSKWVFIATGAGITCLMRSAIGDIVAAGASDLTTTLLSECAAIARAAGFPPAEAALTRTREMFTKAGSPLTASMLRDIESNSPTEGDHILGDLLERGSALQVSAPLLRTCYLHVKAYEARRIRSA